MNDFKNTISIKFNELHSRKLRKTKLNLNEGRVNISKS